MLATLAADGGVKEILDQIAQGRSIADLARERNVSRAFLSEILNQDLPALRAARALAASAFAEQSIEIADAAEPATAQVARLRIETRQWLAARWGREVYGERSGPSVQLNLAQVHADVIRRRCAEQKRAEQTKRLEAQSAITGSVQSE